MLVETMIMFYSKIDGRFLGGYSEHGTFRGELESTLELKAHDYNINVSDIEVKKEYDNKHFIFQALSTESETVRDLMDGSSGVAVHIDDFEKLKGIESLDDGWYLLKGTKQVVEKDGEDLCIPTIIVDDSGNYELVLVDSLGISFISEW